MILTGFAVKFLQQYREFQIVCFTKGENQSVGSQ